MEGLRAVILAGGRGTRLHPYTEHIPKPLVSIGDKETMLGIILQQLARQGFTHVTLAINHLADQIIHYVGDGSRWGLKIDYSREESPLSTIGPLTLIDNLPEHFLTINGDTLTDFDCGKFLRTHISKNDNISVAIKKREVVNNFGVLEFNQNRELVRFLEKPTHVTHVAMGINCYARRIIESLPRAMPYGFDTLMQDSIQKNEKISVHEHEGLWLDIGRPEDYHHAVEHYGDISKMILGAAPAPTRT